MGDCLNMTHEFPAFFPLPKSAVHDGIRISWSISIALTEGC
jgi:hypothetical protein